MTPERWQRIKQIFQAAVERPAESRGAYAAEQANGDIELLREVEKMLRHATGTGLMDTPAWQGIRIENVLAAGEHLGPYEIVEEAGSGGMGRVYKARDTRLGRTVAIKVLNAEFSHRLWTEGRAISALNHPHVCALHDVGDQDGTAFLVMEYVEGESLAARVARGPLPVDAVLRYGAEIADALAEAHAQGIVHRDLKPANIMITASGVKVLDFGVARMAEDGDSSTDGVAGTAAYMSPSQLNGNPADARSDVFALGLVLYEMLTGTRYAAVPAALPANVPAGLKDLIERCLRRDGTARVQRMDEVRSTLEQLREQAARPVKRRWKTPVEIAVALAMAAALGLPSWRAMHPAAPSVARAPAGPPAAASPIVPAVNRNAPETAVPIVPAVHRKPPAMLATLSSYKGIQRDPSLSPDGAKVAFAWNRQRGFGIYTRRVNSDEPLVELTDGAGAEDWGPAWSPDGSRIAFERRAHDWGIYWVPAKGGAQHLVSPIARQNSEALPQLSWSHDGQWIAAPDRDSSGTEIALLSAAGGARRTLTSNPTGVDHAPAFSPDGKSLAYTSCASGVQRCDVYLIDLDRSLAPRRRRRLTTESAYVRGIAWLPDGRSLVYASGRTVSDTCLWRVSVEPPGEPQRINLAGAQAHHPTISMTGGLLAYTRMGKWNLMMIENFY